MVADAVFLLIGEIGVAGAVLGRVVVIILGPVVDVVDHHADRGSGGHTLKNAGQNPNRVRFFALGDEFRCAGRRRSRKPWM